MLTSGGHTSSLRATWPLRLPLTEDRLAKFYAEYGIERWQEFAEAITRHDALLAGSCVVVLLGCLREDRELKIFVRKSEFQALLNALMRVLPWSALERLEPEETASMAFGDEHSPRLEFLCRFQFVSTNWRRERLTIFVCNANVCGVLDKSDTRLGLACTGRWLLAREEGISDAICSHAPINAVALRGMGGDALLDLAGRLRRREARGDMLSREDLDGLLAALASAPDLEIPGWNLTSPDYLELSNSGAKLRWASLESSGRSCTVS